MILFRTDDKNLFRLPYLRPFLLLIFLMLCYGYANKGKVFMPNISFLPYFWNCFLFLLCTAGARSFLPSFPRIFHLTKNHRPPPAPGRNDDYRLFSHSLRLRPSLLVCIREYWMIYRGAAFSSSHGLAFPLPFPSLPSLVSKLSLFLSLPVCRQSPYF